MDTTVLLVDDEDPVRLLVRTMLELDGYAVLEAGNGAEAQEVADRHGGGIDLLVTDIMMPGINGFELAQRLVAPRPARTPVLLKWLPVTPARQSRRSLVGLRLRRLRSERRVPSRRINTPHFEL